MNKLAGTKFAAQSKGANRCTYTSTKVRHQSADDFGMLTGIKATTESLSSLAASEKASFGSGAASKPIKVKGASEAILVTGQDAGQPRVLDLDRARRPVVSGHHRRQGQQDRLHDGRDQSDGSAARSLRVRVRR